MASIDIYDIYLNQENQEFFNQVFYCTMVQIRV
jgi:hypothetical protein